MLFCRSKSFVLPLLSPESGRSCPFLFLLTVNQKDKLHRLHLPSFSSTTISGLLWSKWWSLWILKSHSYFTWSFSITASDLSYFFAFRSYMADGFYYYYYYYYNYIIIIIIITSYFLFISSLTILFSLWFISLHSSLLKWFYLTREIGSRILCIIMH